MMLAVCTSITVVILNLHHRGKFGTKVPRLIQVLVLNWMARIMFLKDTVDRNTQGNNCVAANENFTSDGKTSEMWNEGDSKGIVASNGLSKSEDISHSGKEEMKGPEVKQVRFKACKLSDANTEEN